ncbi:MAG: site-specific integrase [Terriglobales bacterium]
MLHEHRGILESVRPKPGELEAEYAREPEGARGLAIPRAIRKSAVTRVPGGLSPNAARQNKEASDAPNSFVAVAKRGKPGEFMSFQAYTESVPGRCENTEPDTDHSVLQERKRGSHHYRRSGDSRNLLCRAAVLKFSTKENSQMKKQEKRARGSGSIFQNGSSVFWIKFYDRGIARRESSLSTDHKAAQKLLKRRLAEVETKTYIPCENVRMDELIADLLSEYKEKQLKSIDAVKARWTLHLQPFFTRTRVTDIGTDRIRRYSDMRREQTAAPATINRELSILKRAFNLALESTPPKVKTVPYIPMQVESNTRTGFLKDEEYSRLASECAKEGLWLRALLAVAYNFGWRKGELLALRVRQIDLTSSTIRLEVGSTKNGAGRTVKMTQEVFTLLSACVAGKQKDDFAFTRANGAPVKVFRKRWRVVCKRADVPKLFFHDLRRTGVRNLRRLGIAESVAMKISGHKTASVFRRYDITDEADLADAAARLDEKRNAQTSEVGQSLGIVAPKPGNSVAIAVLPPLAN